MNHPNIATVHDVGEQDGVTFFVMELVRGESLRALVRNESPGMERSIDIATGIAAGLVRAHIERVFHRDLKPDNIVLTDEGVPKILDFGLSKLISGDPSPEEPMPLDMPTVPPPADWPLIAVMQNFAPRSTVPTIMINGRKDFGAPVETNIKPMFDLLDLYLGPADGGR